MQPCFLLAVSSSPSSFKSSSPQRKFLNSRASSSILACSISCVASALFLSFFSRYFSLVSASKGACVASGSHFFQVSLGDTGPVCLSAAGSCRRGHLPVPLSPGANSFSSMVFLGNVFHIQPVLVLLYTFIRLQHSRPVSFGIHRVSRHEILKRQTSTALFPLGCGSLCMPCPAAVMAPGRGCPAAISPPPSALLPCLMRPCFLGRHPALLALACVRA